MLAQWVFRVRREIAYQHNQSSELVNIETTLICCMLSLGWVETVMDDNLMLLQLQFPRKFSSALV
jgi:hypothetical protein